MSLFFTLKYDTPSSSKNSVTPPLGRKAVFLPFFPLLLVIYHSMGIVVFYGFMSELVYHPEILVTKPVQI